MMVRRCCAVAGLALATAVATSCNSSSHDSQRDLAKICRGSLDALGDYDQVRCIGAGYYKELVEERLALPPVSAQDSTVHRSFTLEAVSRSGRPAGYVDVTELIKKEHVTVETGSEYAVIRPGTCRRPGRGRSIHVHGSTEADVSFDNLLSSTFAVETIDDDALPETCAQHLGHHDLRTNATGWKTAGTAKRTATKLSFKGRDYWFTLTPERGLRTLVDFTMAGSANFELGFHLRPGTCSRVGTGRELPMWVPARGDGEYASSGSVTIVGVPFTEFLHRRWVLEVDELFPNPGMQPDRRRRMLKSGHCVQL